MGAGREGRGAGGPGRTKWGRQCVRSVRWRQGRAPGGRPELPAARGTCGMSWAWAAAGTTPRSLALCSVEGRPRGWQPKASPHGALGRGARVLRLSPVGLGDPRAGSVPSLGLGHRRLLARSFVCMSLSLLIETMGRI